MSTRATRIAAMEDGISLREFVVEALRREVERRERERQGRESDR
jgi:hypothetical protein